MKRIIFPGWAVPNELYLSYRPDDILDLGFFTAENNNVKDPVTEINPADLFRIFLQKIIADEPVTVIAHSLGSLLALQSALDSDSIKAIILIGGFARFTQILPDYPDGKPESGVSMMQNMMKLSPKMVLDKFYQAMAVPSDFSITTKGKAHAGRLICGLQYLRDTDLREALKTIRIPVLIMHGNNDQIVSLRLAEYLRDNIAGSTLQVFENAGHALPFTHSDQCRKLIDDFERACD